MCIRLGIPLPEAGHWNKVLAGKATFRKPLPEKHEGDKEVMLHVRTEGQADIPGESSSLELLQQAIEDDSSLNLVVGDTLKNPDPLIQAAQKSLNKKDRYLRDGLLHTGLGELDIKTSPVLINRVLCLMDVFIKAMRARQHGFLINERESYVVLGKEKIQMKLREMLTRTMTEKNGYQHAAFHTTGRLSFRFDRYSTFIEIKDARLPVEAQLSKLIARLELLGEKLRFETIEREKSHERYLQEQKRKEEYANRRKLELESFKLVLEDAGRWQKSVQLRAYIDHVEQKAIKDGTLNEELRAWLDWIKKKADWFDPTVGLADEWLSSVDPNSVLKEEMKPGSFSLFDQDRISRSRQNGTGWPLLPWYVKKNS